jgi:hypothetical protein
MTKTYQEVLEAIQKANPELMKLEFGCKVELDDGDSSPVVGTVTKAYFPEWNDIVPYQIDFLHHPSIKPTSASDYPVYGVMGGGWEILGKEPQLQHVLIAMDGKLKSPFFQTSNEWELFLFHKYNLSLPFSQQDESLYTFLHKILCG